MYFSRIFLLFLAILQAMPLFGMDQASIELNRRIAQTPLNNTTSGLTPEQMQALNNRLSAVVMD